MEFFCAAITCAGDLLVHVAWGESRFITLVTIDGTHLLVADTDAGVEACLV